MYTGIVQGLGRVVTLTPTISGLHLTLRIPQALLHDPKVLVTGFDRPNLYFEVRRGENKKAFIERYLKPVAVRGMVAALEREGGALILAVGA